MPFYRWSQVAATNGTADPTALFPEGMAPSALNDGNRGQMAALKQWGDDIAGAIVTGGTATAYTVASYSVFNSLANMNGQMIAFSPHATNGATVTLNVDSLGAKPLRSAPNTELLAGVLIQGTPYLAVYNNSDGAFYLQGFYGQPYNVPLLGGLDYWDTTTPNSSFIFPAGQAISRVTYSAAFARWGTTFGAGDGSTTFNVPDKAGRVSVMKEASASRLTSTYFGGNSTVLGAVGGLESHTLTTAQLAAHSHANTLTDPGHSHVTDRSNGQSPSVGTNGLGSNNLVNPSNGSTNSATTGISINNVNAGSGSAHNNVQPTIVCNYIIRII
jgi:microcystin-dependent protein